MFKELAARCDVIEECYEYMLAFAGQAFLMQNAPVELLEQAARSGWAVIGSNEEDGAAEAILRMLEKAQRPLTV